jgi:hypothetical protein
VADARLVVQNAAEFLSYSLLHTIVQRDSALFLTQLGSIPPALRASPFVTHAVAVMHAVQSRRWSTFFRLRRQCRTDTARVLLNMLASRVRLSAFHTLAAACRPGIAVSDVAALLGWQNADAAAFLAENGAVLCEKPSAPPPPLAALSTVPFSPLPQSSPPHSPSLFRPSSAAALASSLFFNTQATGALLR